MRAAGALDVSVEQTSIFYDSTSMTARRRAKH